MPPNRNGAPERIRTSDQQLRRLLLYPLSYRGQQVKIVPCDHHSVSTATSGGQNNREGGPVVPTPLVTKIGVVASG